MSAAALLREARSAGIEVALVDGAVKMRGPVSPEMRSALREAKAGVVAVLAGNACRWCGDRLAWPRPAGVIFADGTAECMPCGDAEVERLWRAAERVTSSPDALTDDAELMLQSGGLSE